MRKVFVFGMILLLASCGSSKKVVSSKTSTTTNKGTEVKVVPTKEVEKEVEKVINETKKKSKTYLSETTLAYVEKFAPMAMEEMHKYKIPASITLAQGILESGSGTSNLARKSNNHFGIKCHVGWEGERVTHDDDKKGECFRKYEYASTSYKDHSLFLTTRSRYADLFTLRKGDYKGWAKGLKKAGYATDPKYPNKLISYIERYNLDEYDEMVLKGKVDLVTIIDDRKEESPVKVVVVHEEENGFGYDTHTVEDEDTLYSISRKYGVSVEELKELNHLSDNTIHKGDVLRLKTNSELKNHHIVQQKETLYSISKKYGLTVDALKKMNDLRSNDISIGQELRIK